MKDHLGIILPQHARQSILDGAGQLHRIPRGVAPTQAAYLTAYIDVHDAILYRWYSSTTIIPAMAALPTSMPGR